MADSPYSGNVDRPDPFSIKETGVNGIQVDLVEWDTPHGRPRKGAAYELGGPVERKVIYLPGRTTPIIHVDQARFRPTMIKGHLRDHLWGTDGHARYIVEGLERIRKNCRQLQLTHGPYRWDAFMEDGNWKAEGYNDFVYEIRFDILDGPLAKTGKPRYGNSKLENPKPAPDYAAEMRALLLARQKTVMALLLLNVVAQRLGNLFAEMDTAMAIVEQVAGDFEQIGKAPALQVQRLLGKCNAAATKCREIQAAFDAIPATYALSDTSAASQAQWIAQQYGVTKDVLAVLDMLRTLSLQARQAQNESTRVYQVAPGDTLESIARTKLGNPGRASEIGLRPQQLKPGRLIRLPKEA